MQRDILPIVEGTTVNTKYGMVKTDHILFIAAGAFHVSKPSDLIPELQGRFPIRVELEPLGREDFVRILTEPKNALVRQYMALLSTEGVTLRFTAGAIGRIADFATMVNERTENIGARRLHTVMEKLLDEVSFDAPGPARARPSRSTRRTSTACSPRSRATKICRATSCDRFPRSSSGRHALRVRRVRRSLPRCRGVRQEGPPLAPLRLVPGPASDRGAARGDAVQLQFTLPTRNQNGPGPIDLGSSRDLRRSRSRQARPPANRDLLLTEGRLVGIRRRRSRRRPKGRRQPPDDPADTRPRPGDARHVRSRS